MKLAFAIVAVASGCIDIPQAPLPQCTSDSDCNTVLGEVCSDNVCYGGPPTGAFAAIAVPPATRDDLVTLEIPDITLPNNGDLGTTTFDNGVTLKGRVEAFCSDACTSTTIAATIIVTRPSLFAGGPGFQAITSSTAGLPIGTNSFSLVVPPSHAGDPDYTISIVPSGNGLFPPANGTVSAATLAPPKHLTVNTTTSSDLGTITLGSMDAPKISGLLTDGSNHPLSQYRVVARGKLEAGGATTEVSTVAYTTNGQFSLTLSEGALAPISIVATPYDPNVVAPTLTLGGLDAKPATRTLAQPANTGNKHPTIITIQGLSDKGDVGPVAGAHVTVTGTYDPPLHDSASAVLSVEATTSDDGTANVTLLDGMSLASSYMLRVVPPASSHLGVVFDAAFDLESGDPVRLPPRVELHGNVFDVNGAPAGKLAVTARPSLRFTWSEPDDAAAFLAEIPVPTAVTGDAGDFAIWVDLAVGGVWGHYDLAFDAPTGVALASYTLGDVEIPRQGNLTSLTLPDTHLPGSAFLHGSLADSTHLQISGGELRVFQLVTDTSLCTQAPYPPDDCVIPAQLLGHAASDDEGTLKLALPRE